MSRGVAHGVELALDERSTAAVTELLDALEAAGIATLRGAGPHAHPHVSITVAANASPAELAEALGGIADAGLAGLSLSSLGAFVAPERVLFLGVTPTPALLALHEGVSARLAAARIATWPLYDPGSWVPHCTLAMRPASLGEALTALDGAALPIAAAPTAIRVVEVPTGKVVATPR